MDSCSLQIGANVRLDVQSLALECVAIACTVRSPGFSLMKLS
jgi:hypothetical protein